MNVYINNVVGKSAVQRDYVENYIRLCRRLDYQTFIYLYDYYINVQITISLPIIVQNSEVNSKKLLCAVRHITLDEK